MSDGPLTLIMGWSGSQWLGHAMPNESKTIARGKTSVGSYITSGTATVSGGTDHDTVLGMVNVCNDCFGKPPWTSGRVVTYGGK